MLYYTVELGLDGTALHLRSRVCAGQPSSDGGDFILLKRSSRTGKKKQKNCLLSGIKVDKVLLTNGSNWYIATTVSIALVPGVSVNQYDVHRFKSITFTIVLFIQ
jgi:hypothetical protein